MSKDKGQALVEFAISFPLLLMLILLTLDPFFYAANLGLAKVHTFVSAREASIYLADGESTCQEMASRTVSPVMPLVIDWNLVVNPCWGENENWSTPTGEQVVSVFEFSMQTIFWGGIWEGRIATTNVFQ